MKNKLGLLETDMLAITAVLEKFPTIEKAIVFGSRAKGNFKNGSDVDLALKGNDLNLRLIHEVSMLLNEETKMPYQFDVLSYLDIKEPTLTFHIDRVGVVIFERK
jgi:predicted nucleotidyltransferase